VIKSETPQGVDLIYTHFPNLTDVQKEQFAQLGPLYAEWNAQINVISRKDIDHIYEHHVLHSLGIAKVMKFADHSKILDVGTGGGFPGIPLAILYPKVQFTLVDSTGKKIKVVNEVSSALGLKNVTAIHERAEKVLGSFDFVVSRAVAKLHDFIPWVRNKIRPKQINPWPNGMLLLKGGDLVDELAKAKATWEVLDLSDHFEGEFYSAKKVVYVKLV
jgi:16S rRNA (guanine527-N7)-methyltransferase